MGLNTDRFYSFIDEFNTFKAYLEEMLTGDDVHAYLPGTYDDRAIGCDVVKHHVIYTVERTFEIHGITHGVGVVGHISPEVLHDDVYKAHCVQAAKLTLSLQEMQLMSEVSRAN